MKLNSLYLRNFKGLKELLIDFKGKNTSISGENGVGKTTVFDAFMWLLFDKDSNNSSNFNIKTLDKHGQAIHGLEHEVKANIVLEDGRAIELQKIYKEKWTKKKGQADKQLTGHTTNYFIDEVPVKKSEYTEKINSLVDENIFKLVTNPLYFNEKLKWTDRRDILMQVIGDIDDSVIIDSNKKLNPLKELLDGKDIDKFKSMVASRRKKLNDELKTIPVRIDEINQGLPELNIDFEKVIKQIEGLKTEIDTFDEQILDESKVYEQIAKKKSVLYSKQSELQKLEHQAELEKDKPKRELESKLNNIEFEIKSKINKIDSLKSQNEDRQATISELKVENDELRTEYNQEFSKELEFNEEEFICPTCSQDLPEDSKEEKKAEMLESFNKNKAKRIANIQAKGKKNATRIEELSKTLAESEKQIESLDKEIESFELQQKELKQQIENFVPGDTLKENAEYRKLQEEVQVLKVELETPVETSIEYLKSIKSEKESELDNLKSKLAIKEQYEKSQERITELTEREKELANKIAELEGQEFLCEEFVRTKVDLLESRINSKFNTVRFKLFNTLVNGALEETCETLIDGVPFADANNAAKINAGIDIINTLSEHFDVQAPIFVDNAESVNELVPCKSQVIRLVVTKDEELKVEVD